jgi:hypothetical protein
MDPGIDVLRQRLRAAAAHDLDPATRRGQA